MRYSNILWQRKFLAATLTLLCAALAGLGVWRVTGKVAPPVAKYTPDELTDAITDITVEQLATVSDGAVQWAADTYDETPDGEIKTRESGKWGTLTKQEFIDQVKAGRDWSQNGDVAVKAALRPLVSEEVNDRVAALSEDLPEQFGNAQTDGVTPAQAVVVAYSVAADAPLFGSQEDLAKEKVPSAS